MITHLKWLADWALPPSLREDPTDAGRSVRLLISLTLVAAVAGVILIIRIFARGESGGVSARVALLGLLLVVPMLTRRGHVAAAKRYFLGVAYIIIMSLSVLSGGATSRALYLLAILPFLAAGLETGHRTIGIVTVGGLASVVALYAVHYGGLVIPPRILTHTLTLDVLMLAVATLLVYLVALRFGARRAAARAALAAAIREVERANVAASDARARVERAVASKEAALTESAHALRGPVDTVLASARRLVALTAPEHREAAAMIERCAHQLAARVATYVAYQSACQAAPGGSSARVPFDVEAAVSAVVSAARQDAEGKGLSLRLERPCDLQRDRLGDPGGVTAIVTALVDNAIKFTAAGGVLVRVSCVDPTDDVVITVEDSGFGVEPAVAEQLFEPFTRAEPATSMGHDGAGLSLATARRVATNLGGSISLDASSAAGSTFSLTLPLSRVPAADAARPAGSGAP